MSSAMDWSQDFCLSCDNANHTEGPYCSEACRLSDLDRSTDAESSSNVFGYYSQYTAPSTSYTWSSAASSPSRTVGMYLPPAVDFSALRASAAFASSSPLPTTTAAPKPSSSRHRQRSQAKRTLTTSSSRSSLSSVTTTGSVSSHGISDQAIDQLRNYFNSFDQNRELKRRMTLA